MVSRLFRSIFVLFRSLSESPDQHVPLMRLENTLTLAVDALPIPVLLCRFAAFVNTLGTQPVTITLSSIVSDMISDHASSGGHAIWFSDVGYLQTAVENFVMTRECFFHHPDRAPFVEAAFQATNIHAGHMDIDIHYRWNPPRVEFHGLKNVVSEGDLVSLRPTVANIRPPHGPFEHSSFLVQVEFYTGSDDAWLKWNSGQEAFQGTVGHRYGPAYASYASYTDRQQNCRKLWREPTVSVHH